MVRKGFTRAYGTSLRRIIAASTNNRFTAFLSGIGVTMVLQSSTATAFLLSSFASRQLITTSAAMAVILGADVGTTFVAQILSFDLSWLMPLLLLAGVSLHKIYRRGGRNKHLARVLIGVGLILLALGIIRDASAPLKNSYLLPLLLGPLQGEPLLGIILAALITWALHSSLAAVLLFASFAQSGIVPLEMGLVLILGANIGGAVVPLIANLKSSPASLRIPAGNLGIRVLSVLIALPLLGFVPALLDRLSVNPSHELVMFHTLFNVSLAALFLPFIGSLCRIGEALIPDRPTRESPGQPQYLDKEALETPVIALAGAARETLRMAEMVEKMLKKTIITFETNNEDLIKEVRIADDDVDKLYSAIKLYMTQLTHEALDPKEGDRYIQILTFATNLEHVGDIIDKSLMELAKKKIRQRDEFSKEGFQEIKDFHSQVLGNVRLAQNIFLSEDPKLASELVQGKKNMRMAEIESSKSHFNRLRSRLPETIATSSLHLDIIRDYRRINTYITSVAYTILDNASEHKDERKS